MKFSEELDRARKQMSVLVAREVQARMVGIAMDKNASASVVRMVFGIGEAYLEGVAYDVGDTPLNPKEVDFYAREVLKAHVRLAEQRLLVFEKETPWIFRKIAELLNLKDLKRYQELKRIVRGL